MREVDEANRSVSTALFAGRLRSGRRPDEQGRAGAALKFLRADGADVCLSGAAYQQVRDRVKGTFVDLGEKSSWQ